MAKTVVIIGTLDTKGPELLYLKQRIESHGLHTLVVNTGIMGEPHFTPDASAGKVAARTAGISVCTVTPSGRAPTDTDLHGQTRTEAATDTPAELEVLGLHA